MRTETDHGRGYREGNQFSGELKVLRKQVIQLKHVVDTKNITIKKLREELADVKQDRSNILLCWAEPSIDVSNSEDIAQFFRDLEEDDA